MPPRLTRIGKSWLPVLQSHEVDEKYISSERTSHSGRTRSDVGSRVYSLNSPGSDKRAAKIQTGIRESRVAR
jgi:hypothetical protein